MRKSIQIVSVVFFLLVIASSPLIAGSTKKATKEQDIRRLLTLTGSGQLGVQVIQQMFASFKRSMPEVPEKFWDEFMKEVDADEMIELVVPIYDKYLTHDEIKIIITFYETPVGKKMIALLPQIMQESMAAGQQWGKEIGERVIKKLKADGYKI